MSGHSKWATIKRKKAVEDSKRGKAFTKLLKEITIAARVGGGDPGGNPRLRLLLDKAKDINMPLENTKRAIKKGTGELPGAGIPEECVYEGYGPNGTAIIIEALTDNKNRMASELRHLFNSRGGSLAESGAVSWMFEKTGVIRAEAGSMREEELLDKLLEYDINDVQYEDGWFEIYCNPKSLEKVKQAVAQLGLKIDTAQLEWVPKNLVNVAADKTAISYDFLAALDDHEDVQNVYTNLA